MARSEFEESLVEAFKLAENSRRAHTGQKRNMADMVHKRKDGTMWMGPTGYRVTMFFRPWHYADAVLALAASEHPEWSLHRFLMSKITDSCPAIAKRPPPKEPRPEAGIASMDKARAKREKLRPGQSTEEERGARMGNHVLAKVAAAQRAR